MRTGFFLSNFHIKPSKDDHKNFSLNSCKIISYTGRHYSDIIYLEYGLRKLAKSVTGGVPAGIPFLCIDKGLPQSDFTKSL